jgi:electron transport complex protein RnfC
MFKSFRGGVHPDDSKRFTEYKAIEKMPLPSRVVVPVRQHIGAPCTPIVAKGERIRTGQILATSENYISSTIHATISGTVLDIADYPHPVYGKCLSIVIESDGLDEWIEGIPTKRNWKELSTEESLSIIREAGIVGMGGATFPTHVKLAPPPDKKIDTFILNAAECEPYLTADYRMMLEYSERIVTGVQITVRLIGAESVYIGIEDNKPDAIMAMKKACKGTNIQVKSLPAKYPQGSEKMLIKVITNREVPPGRLPMDIGVDVQNVGTVIAIADAICDGIPLIERVTTISGSIINEPKNLLIRVGTSFRDAINFCGGFKEQPEEIIMGGPMMGFAQSNLDVAVIKGVSGILALGKHEVNAGKTKACIHCGKCVQACPHGLMPAMFSILGEKGLYMEAKDEYHAFDCAECGSCVFVCPAKRNIVQSVRTIKTKIAVENAAKK